MGRAHEVRAAAMAKTAAMKSKVYSRYGKEIYIAAKSGVADPDMNLALRSKIKEAKANQVPADVIKRAIEKAKGGSAESYDALRYEGFGPAGSTFIVKTLTDNVNRTVGEVRAAFNKHGKSLGVQGSVSFNYEHLCIIEIKSNKYDEIFERLVDEGIDLTEYNKEEDMIEINAPSEYEKKIKDIIEELIPGITFETDEVGYYSKETIKLEGEDKEEYNKLYKALEDIDDVTEIYTNVED